jgi:N-acetylglucosamine-6-phosphate deacetylase
MRLRAERIVTPAGVVAGEISMHDGLIVGVDTSAFGPLGAVGAVDAGALGPLVDLGDRWLVPGFIDGHVHGGAGRQCNSAEPSDVLAVAQFHARHGTTALLATTVSASVAELCDALAAIARACAWGGAGATVLGAHLEGPFLSRARPGAMDPSTFLEPSEAGLATLLAAGEGQVRMVTLAPELPGAVALTRSLVATGVVVSVGHTEAGFLRTAEAVEAGARSATHLFNAMAPFHHRTPGVIGAVLDLADVSCELIADEVHVSAPALRLALAAKGLGGVRLVTDAISAAGMGDGEFLLGSVPARVVDGRARVVQGDALAGSTLTMDRAVAGAVRMLGLGVPEAVGLASANPARLLGVDDRKGAIAIGMDADLAVLDEELRCCGTVVGGRWVFGPELPGG